MQNIAINLLPAEYRAEELKKAKLYKVQALAVAVVLVTAFLASATVALRILQSQKIIQVQSKAEEAEKKVSDFKTSQGYLLLLKNRLNTITLYLGNSSKQAQMYVLMEKLLTPSISVSTISVDKSGNVLILATSVDRSALDLLINNLLSKEISEDKIKEVSVESLNRGKDGVYRLSFKVKPK